jgi:hypothetical protein
MFINFLFENRAVYEIISKNIVKPEATNDVTVWRIRFACRISKTTRTHIHARAHAPGHPHTHALAHIHRKIYNMYCFSKAKTIRERASMLRYTCIACLVITVTELAKSLILAVHYDGAVNWWWWWWWWWLLLLFCNRI